MRDNYVRDYSSSGTFIDKFIDEMREALYEVYDFEHIFGRCHKLVDTSTDMKVVYPVAFNGNREYVSLLPNDEYGSFAFFDIYDPQRNIGKVSGTPKMEINGAIVMWMRLDESVNQECLFTEEIKTKALKELSSSHWLSKGKITVTDIYEQPENIYKGFSIEQLYSPGLNSNDNIGKLDRQMFMFPYYGLRVEFTAIIVDVC